MKMLSAERLEFTGRSSSHLLTGTFHTQLLFKAPAVTAGRCNTSLAAHRSSSALIGDVVPDRLADDVVEVRPTRPSTLFGCIADCSERIRQPDIVRKINQSIKCVVDCALNIGRVGTVSLFDTLLHSVRRDPTAGTSTEVAAQCLIEVKCHLVRPTVHRSPAGSLPLVKTKVSSGLRKGNDARSRPRATTRSAANRAQRACRVNRTFTALRCVSSRCPLKFPPVAL